jgi:hypothetical protein
MYEMSNNHKMENKVNDREGQNIEDEWTDVEVANRSLEKIRDIVTRWSSWDEKLNSLLADIEAFQILEMDLSEWKEAMTANTTIVGKPYMFEEICSIKCNVCSVNHFKKYCPKKVVDRENKLGAVQATSNKDGPSTLRRKVQGPQPL